MKDLRLGVLGMSEGNGHPYSWSAIFNGYDKKTMAECPFPVIPQYLAEQNFPKAAIPNARVTHVWTQDRRVSELVAAASLIETVVDDYEEMIGEVDAVLLARDDAENHLAMSSPFLKAGLPIYIDKPMALSLAGLEEIYALQSYENQIFTCSALAFAEELTLSANDRTGLGSIVKVAARVGKNWDTYGVHVIEPVLKLVAESDRISRVLVTVDQSKRAVEVWWESGLCTLFTTFGDEPVPVDISITGASGKTKILEFQNTFMAFKRALKQFVAVVREQEDTIPKKFVRRVVEIIEAGRQHE